MDNEKLSVVIKNKINSNGEIHLDQVLSTLLVKHLELLETEVDVHKTHFKRMNELFEPIFMGIKTGRPPVS